MFASPVTPPVSVLVPAYNEEPAIVESVRSLLRCATRSYEVIVVNDGSTDATLARLSEAFDLVPVRKALRGPLADRADPRRLRVARATAQLWVVDKENGGKADALNAGVERRALPVRAARSTPTRSSRRTPCCGSAKPLLDEPDLVVATGGIVRIANGCRDRRRPRDRRPAAREPPRHAAGRSSTSARSCRPRRLEPAERAADHLRRVRALPALDRRGGRRLLDATPSARTWSWSCACTGTCASGASATASSSCPTRSAGPRRRRRCGQLSRQRRRWQRGLGETLWRHRARRRQRRATARSGCAAVPYFLALRVPRPARRGARRAGDPSLWWLAGGLSGVFLRSASSSSRSCSASSLSLAALTLEEHSFRRHREGREIARLIGFSFVENLGYRQIVAFWRFLGFFDLVRGRRDWGEMRRKGFSTMPEAPLPPA